jgi:LPXTG-motif cell wall-anchored protein
VPDPAKFFTTPGLWLGLVAAVALVALAVWLRRRREPV